METEKRRLKKEDPGPKIAISFMRNPETGKVDRIRTVKFEPGMIITRNGKRYRLDAKGTQRKID
jgi:hypothetical protein